MDIEELRARQAPLKELYRDQPEKAVVPIGATGSYVEPGTTVTVDSFIGPVRAGQHAALGGYGTDACSADMLMEALLGCAGVTIRVVALAMRLEVRGGTLRAEGTFDARGSLGVDRSVPVGIGPVRIIAELDTDATDQQLAKLGELAERYCIVAQSLKELPELEIRRATS